MTDEAGRYTVRQCITITTANNRVDCSTLERAKPPAPPTTRTTPTTGDTEAPRVKALPSAGKAGTKVRLRYTAVDNTGKTRDTVTVYREGKAIAGPYTGRLRSAVAGKVYAFVWNVPRTMTGLVRFCIQAADAAGNRSAVSCARLTLTDGTKITGGREWSATASQRRGQNGSRFTYDCPAGGSAHHVWGTGVYTDDSSVCTAAVHAGRITLARGGTITIQIRPGLSSYRGTTRYGITSSSYGSWKGSFVVV